MTPRRNLIDLFSTFAQFADDRFWRWVTDSRLRHSMQTKNLQTGSTQTESMQTRSMQLSLNDAGTATETAIETDAELPGTFWALYWYRLWQAQPGGVAEGHLSAYLQETCYWAVQRLIRSQPEHSYPLSDCFQMTIAQLPKILKGYDSTQAASLKTYTNLRFSNAICDLLRQHQATNSRTDWGILRKISQKCLTEALQTAGLSAETIACYCLAWSCYKTCYAPQSHLSQSDLPRSNTATRQLSAPDPKTWETIAALYNQQRERHLAYASSASPDQLDRWLRDCAKRVRAYLNPPITSLNVSRFDENSGELQDVLPDAIEDSPLAQLITQEEIQERQTQKQQINTVLTSALAQLDPQIQTLLALYYRQGLTQQQIAQQLEMKQYTVSRRISSTKETLLTAIARWSQSTLHITLTSPVVQQMSLVLEEWLQTYYAHSVQEAASQGGTVEC